MQYNTQRQYYYNPKQLKLPLDFEILIPFDSEVRTFDEILRRIDLSKCLITTKDLRGRRGYNLYQMLKLVLFCHSIKKRSLREMAETASNDVRLMWLTDECKPSHQAIKDFIDRYLKVSIEKIFIDINKFLIMEENINSDIVYIDGTKIESKANKYTFVWKGSVGKFITKLYVKITNKLNELNERYQVEGICFDVYEEYNIEYLSKVKDFIISEIEKSDISFTNGKGTRKTALQRDYEAISEYLTKLTEYNEHLRIMGDSRNSYSKTDHDATFMRMKDDHMMNNQLKPGYNVQIGVSDEYILHVDVKQERNDYKTMIPFLEGFKINYGYLPTYPVMDAGYGGLTNYRYLKNNGLKLFQKYTMYAKDTKDKKRMKDQYHSHNLIIKDEYSQD